MGDREGLQQQRTERGFVHSLHPKGLMIQAPHRHVEFEHLVEQRAGRVAAAFEAVGRGPMEAAATLRASRLDAIWNVLLPQSARGILTACVLTFAHTIGEFGDVLMVGGNIPERTRVISIAIYELVESVEYAEALILSAGLLVFSFVTLVGVYALNRSYRLRVS